jgi:anti-sigma B factor antagonist
MASKPFAVHGLNLRLDGLRLDVEERHSETIVHCTGKINAENSAAFQAHIRGLIPDSRGHVDAITLRIVLDLTNVTHVDSTGLGALLGTWTAAQRKGCDLEIANLNPHVGKLVEVTKLDTVFRKMKDLFGGARP